MLYSDFSLSSVMEANLIIFFPPKLMHDQSVTRISIELAQQIQRVKGTQKYFVCLTMCVCVCVCKPSCDQWVNKVNAAFFSSLLHFHPLLCVCFFFPTFLWHGVCLRVHDCLCVCVRACACVCGVLCMCPPTSSAPACLPVCLRRARESLCLLRLSAPRR